MKMKLRVIVGLVVLLFVFNSCSNSLSVPEAEQESMLMEAESTSRAYLAKNDVKNYIYDWVDAYVKPINKNGVSGYYVKMEGQGNVEHSPHISTSEAMGYGMRVAIQAYRLSRTSQEAAHFKEMFEGLWRVAHYFTKDNICSWLIPESMSINDASSGATDGDLDITYALIMAHNLFGSESGTSNYKNYRQRVLQKIMGMGQRCTKTNKVLGRYITYILPGNMFQNPEEKTINGKKVLVRTDLVTRTSDWMLHHFRTFTKFIETEYPSLIENKEKYLYKTCIKPWYDLIEDTEYMFGRDIFGSGILPDFIKFESTGTVGGYYYTALRPDSYEAIDLGEEVSTNQMSWNACRVPWRMAMDYEHHRSNTMRIALEKYYKKLHTANIFDTGTEYYLNGNKIHNKFDAAFGAPIAASTVSRKYYGPWQLKKAANTVIYRDLKNLINVFEGPHVDPDIDGYFSDSINLFSILLLTDFQYVPYK